MPVWRDARPSAVLARSSSAARAVSARSRAAYGARFRSVAATLSIRWAPATRSTPATSPFACAAVLSKRRWRRACGAAGRLRRRRAIPRRFRGRCADGPRAEEDDDARDQRRRRKQAQADQIVAGRILHPSHHVRAEESAEIAGGVDERDAGGGGIAAKERRR